jgi:hypothetical protein
MDTGGAWSIAAPSSGFVLRRMLGTKKETSATENRVRSDFATQEKALMNRTVFLEPSAARGFNSHPRLHFFFNFPRHFPLIAQFRTAMMSQEITS